MIAAVAICLGCILAYVAYDDVREVRALWPQIKQEWRHLRARR